MKEIQQVRLAKENRKDIAALVRDAKNELLTQSKAANFCIRKGLPIIRKLFVKPSKSKEPQAIFKQTPRVRATGKKKNGKKPRGVAVEVHP